MGEMLLRFTIINPSLGVHNHESNLISLSSCKYFVKLGIIVLLINPEIRGGWYFAIIFSSRAEEFSQGSGCHFWWTWLDIFTISNSRYPRIVKTTTWDSVGFYLPPIKRKKDNDRLRGGYMDKPAELFFVKPPWKNRLSLVIKAG